MKYLRIQMADSSVWDVPVEVIAKDRAHFLVSENGGDVQVAFNAAYRHFARVPESVDDWATNEMTWAEIAPHAHRVENGKIDYADGWANADKWIVEY